MLESMLQALITQRAAVTAERDHERNIRKALVQLRNDAGRKVFNVDEKAADERALRNIEHAKETLRGLDARIDEQYGELNRAGRGNASVAAVLGGGSAGVATGSDWAQRTATTLLRLGGESRAVVSGSNFDVPHLVTPNVTPMARPRRLIDLLINRLPLTEGAAFDYTRQSVRTNNAAVVADNAQKPTSVMTMETVQDRARVVAHLSEPAPIRLLSDVQGLTQWLTAEMAQGVLDKLENSVIAGNSSGEEFTGLLSVSGTRAQAFATDVPTTLRKALTTAQTVGEEPNAIVLSPADAEQFDLLRWGSSGAFLTGGVTNDTGSGFGSSANVFGGNEIQRVISPSMPSGTAVLGNWNNIQLRVREDVNVQMDASGVLFGKNQFVMRAEGRFGLCHLRPSSFIICTLHA